MCGFTVNSWINLHFHGCGELIRYCIFTGSVFVLTSAVDLLYQMSHVNDVGWIKTGIHSQYRCRL